MAERGISPEVALRELVQTDRPITYGIVQPGPFVRDGIPLVRGRDYSAGWRHLSDIVRVTPEVEHPYRRARLKPGDILMTIVGAGTGNTAVVPEHLDGANITQTTARIAVDPAKADPRYVLSILRSAIGQALVHKHVKGGAQPGLNLCDIEQFEIPLPDREVQRLAAEIWNEWDCAIATTDALISAKLKQKTALLSKTFLSARDVSTSPSAGWRHTPISELARVCGGGTPDTSKPAYWGGAVAWCTPTDITSLQSRWLDATERTLTEAGLAACSAEVLPVGSVVLCSRASVGACAIARIPVATNQGFQSLVPLRKHDTHFLYYLVQAVARRLLRISGGSTFLEFPGGELSKLIVAAPGPAERDRIGSAFGAIDDEIDLLAAQADALRVQKRGLMQKLLTDEWELSAAKVPEAAE